MTIYIEQSLFENFIIDFLLLNLSLSILKYKCSNYKLCIASLIGSFTSLFAPLINSYLSVILKFVLSILMILIILPKVKFKFFIYIYISFLSFTFLFGGLSFAIKQSFSTFFSKDINIPFFYILVACVLVFYSSLLLLKKIYSRKGSVKFEYNITLHSESIQLNTIAFLDSGNKLLDEGRPVILIDTLTFIKLYPNESLSAVLLKKTEKLSMKNTHILSINNINNSKSTLIAFTLPKLQIENHKEFENISCAIALKKFNLEVPTSCLLNPLLF